MEEHLGKILVDAGKITEEQLKKAIEHKKQHGGHIIDSLLILTFIEDENALNTFLIKQLNVGKISLDDIKIKPEVIAIISSEIAKKYKIIPIFLMGKTLFVATDKPDDISLVNTLSFVVDYEISLVFAKKTDIENALKIYYGLEEDSLSSVTAEFEEELQVIDEDEEEDEFSAAELKQAVREKPVVKLLNSIISDAVNSHASDIHIEAYEDVLRIRYRIDGVLHEISQMPVSLHRKLISRIKVMSGLNISERRLPQDGRIKLKIKNRKIEFRISIIPCIFGERVMMRILDPESLMLDITKLGFPEHGLKLFNKMLHMPYGMILSTGPSGCGKTTTLYSAISVLNKPDVNISTVEDPVEFNLEGVNQVQVKPEVGLNFASALRSFLRQDPDIILVGEIRDLETADISVKAALTGHLVFSTLHTNDAPSTVTRLINMGVPPFLVASAVKLVISQRLLRKICVHCKQEYEPEPEMIEILGIDMNYVREKGLKFYRGAGCPRCGGSGYKGRIAVFEMMPMVKKLQKLVMEVSTAMELSQTLQKMGMKNLRQEAIDRMFEGITTVEQVICETTE